MLANDSGSLKKTNKSALARKLEGNSSPAETIPQLTVCVIDGMSILHKMSGGSMTFEELSGQLFASVLRASAGCTRIDLIFNVYQQLSIKQAENIKGVGARNLFHQYCTRPQNSTMMPPYVRSK